MAKFIVSTTGGLRVVQGQRISYDTAGQGVVTIVDEQGEHVFLAPLDKVAYAERQAE